MEEEGDEGSEKVSKMRGREGKRRQGEENRQGDGRSGGRKVADREREGTAKCSELKMRERMGGKTPDLEGCVQGRQGVADGPRRPAAAQEKFSEDDQGGVVGWHIRQTVVYAESNVRAQRCQMVGLGTGSISLSTPEPGRMRKALVI